jgi:prepilin-type N-terminal cleavage/methylation domain-containing protein/prepilin-type processing-associated H-X9-DG protein
VRFFRFWRSSPGFTLIELLVVIAIIAILALAGMGAYSSAITKARTIACEGNLRAIGVAMLSFASDNDGWLPESGGIIPYNSVDATTGKNGWMQQLGPYVGGLGNNGINKIFTCPDSSHSIPSDVNFSYFNGAHAAMAESGGFGAVRLSKVHNASTHILAGDIAFPASFTAADMDKDDYTQDPAFNGITSTNDGRTGSGTLPIHAGSVNILFMDGHIENVRGFDNTNMTTVYQGPGAQYNYLYTSP